VVFLQAGVIHTEARDDELSRVKRGHAFEQQLNDLKREKRDIDEAEVL